MLADAVGGIIGKVPVLEARQLLKDKGIEFSVAVFRYLYPLDPVKVREALKGFTRLVKLEQNYSGQLGRLLRMECGVETQKHLGKYDGRILTVEDAAALLESGLGGKV